MAWYWIVLICVAGVAVLYLLLCYLIARRVLKAATTPVAHTLQEARTLQGEKEKMDFSEYDNVWRKESFILTGVQGKISGEIVYNTPTTPAKVAVVCHGHTWNRINSLKYAKVFYNKGYSLVLYDHAYFGLSQGTHTTLGDKEKFDLSTVLDFVRQKFGKDAVVCLHGESMGAATVLLELSVRNDVSFVVADCGFSDTMKYYRELSPQLTHLPAFPIVDMANAMSKRRYGYDFSKVKPIDAVRQSNVPICFIHGGEDKFISPHHSQWMYNASKNPLSELHIVDGAGHACSYNVDNSGYCNIVSRFIDKVEANLSLPKASQNTTK